MALDVTPVYRNLRTRVTFFGLEAEDLFAILALAVILNLKLISEITSNQIQVLAHGRLTSLARLRQPLLDLRTKSYVKQFTA